MIRKAVVAAALALLVNPAAAATEADPLNSGNWEWVRDFLFEDAETVFDDRVIVQAPTFAEDAMNVPFVVDARALPDVERIVVFY